MRDPAGAAERSDAIIVGAGIIGLACAWRAAQAGLSVTVVDDAPGRGAWSVAAGMVAPVTEVAYGEQQLLRLTIRSARAWPGFAAELEAAAGAPVGHRSMGTLLVGYDADDVAALGDLHDFQRELGLDVQRMRSRECREREPLLSPRVRGGLFAREDHQVDPRLVVAALREASARTGAVVRHGRVARVEHADGRVTGVTLTTGERLRAGHVVLAAGCWSGLVAGLPDEVVPPVRPVKGQVLRLAAPDGRPAMSTTVRGVVTGRSIYLVPRDDGNVIVGATMEERGFDVTITAGATRQLLDDAAAIVPGVDELQIVETLAGLRPSTPDNRPLIGPTELDGLLLATGHHRHGVLLTPVTAEAVTAHLAGRDPDPSLEVADPRRDGIGRTSATATSGSST